jgi:hypothetical protein
VEVERAPTVAVEAEEVISRTFRKARRLQDFDRQTEAIHLRPNAFHALTVVIPRRILASNADEVSGENQDGVLV